MNPVTHYVMFEGERKGPYTIGQLQSMWNNGTITSETQHWMDGYNEWMPLDYIRDELEPAPQPMRAYQAKAVPQAVYIPKSRGIYIILGLFLGGLFGIHNFYVGRYSPAVIQLVITLLIGWLVIPLAFVAFWVIIECLTVNRDGQNNPLA
jgi:TM2 domain-containing membrane protein YozV